MQSNDYSLKNFAAILHFQLQQRY